MSKADVDERAREHSVEVKTDSFAKIGAVVLVLEAVAAVDVSVALVALAVVLWQLLVCVVLLVWLSFLLCDRSALLWQPPSKSLSVVADAFPKNGHELCGGGWSGWVWAKQSM